MPFAFHSVAKPNPHPFIIHARFSPTHHIQIIFPSGPSLKPPKSPWEMSCVVARRQQHRSRSRFVIISDICLIPTCIKSNTVPNQKRFTATRNGNRTVMEYTQLLQPLGDLCRIAGGDVSTLPILVENMIGIF
eukprot:GHVO01069638.1.p1 GENE.GHVO01069638.1~~GHVO01069638.1.p1  ORF type:complete len:133 (-),score=2.58 GHVO01069638.1:23-421(-)